MNRSLAATASAALLAVAGCTGAQGSPLPDETAGAVSYVSGGIGSDAAEALRQAAADYPLTLELAAAAGGPRDEYISDARVEIRDRQGTPVLRTRTQGPLLLVRLPAGSYAVDVDWNGAHRHKSVEVGERPQRLLVEFPGSLDPP
ncbi:MAG TPA: carboxypeptidase regulatory-like domain-containing protein [Casimicrobiaceae bacterium]|nr:carboxypeptidase regulatory-like domain-containing protein [Casimicrobiaceae bacterium]